jgi:hypothetical protein
MNAARTGCCQAHAQPARELGVSAGHKCGRFFVPNMDETDLVLAAC